MKKTKFKLRTNWEPPVAFAADLPWLTAQTTQLEQLKQRLLGDLTQSTTQTPLRQAYRRAADDAASLAWLTPFPLLFLPALLEEKAAEARLRTQKQATMLNKTVRTRICA